MKQYVTDGTANANVFMTYANDQAGVVGIAYLGVVCNPTATWREAIVEYFTSDAATGQVITTVSSLIKFIWKKLLNHTKKFRQIIGKISPGGIFS